MNATESLYAYLDTVCPKPTPCRCERLHFPHRRDQNCIDLERDDYTARDERDQMEREWIADRRADMPYMNGGRS